MAGRAGKTPAAVTDPRLGEVLKALDPPAGTKPWHGGASVLGCLRGVSAEAAVWKPAPDRHSIWELALHIAYWKYAVRRWLTGEERGGFPRSPANWPEVPDLPDAKAWKADRRLLREEHRRLVEAIRAFDPARLDDDPESGEWTSMDRLTGIVQHDMYHTGQIQIMKRIYASLGG